MHKILLNSTSNNEIESITIDGNNALNWNFMQALLENIYRTNRHNPLVEALEDIKLWANLSDEEVNQILTFSPCERKGDTTHLKSPAAETAPDELLIRIYEAIKEKAPHVLG